MKIAIASTGLGHVTRGIETWALSLATSLTKVDDIDVTLFCGATLENQDNIHTVVIPCLKRSGKKARFLAKVMPGFAWRWGLKSVYGWEQYSFWRNLRRVLETEQYDILHVQDPMLAYWCRKCRNQGLIRTKEILAHGTEEPVEFLNQFPYVQHLAPWHFDQAFGYEKKCWTMIPNFVDTQKFYPRNEFDGKSANLRNKLSIPQDAFVVGCAAAIKKTHKRIDYLIREFSEFSRKYLASHPNCNTPPYLIVAGARADESDDIFTMAEDLGNGFVKILFDLPLDQMPDFYRSLDLFVLTSLFEMMPIAVLEALASGIPLVVNKHPVLDWMVGAGGESIDMGRNGALSDILTGIDSTWLNKHGVDARRRAEEVYSKDVVVNSYIDYYTHVRNGNTI